MLCRTKAEVPIEPVPTVKLLTPVKEPEKEKNEVDREEEEQKLKDTFDEDFDAQEKPIDKSPGTSAPLSLSISKMQMAGF